MQEKKIYTYKDNFFKNNYLFRINYLFIFPYILLTQMTHLTQRKKGVCNTNIKTPEVREITRGRVWQFTLNNYKDEDIKLIESLDCNHVFQEETGAKGTKHLQGVLIYKNAISFNSLKKHLPTAHIEKGQNQNALLRYSSKKETRTGNIYTNIKEDNLLKYIDTSNTGILVVSKKKTLEDEKISGRQKFIDFMNAEMTNDIWKKLTGGADQFYYGL